MGHGSEDQRKAGEEYAKRLGLRLVAPPFQLVESAFDEDNRAEFDRFMETAEALGVEHLLFGRVDRSLRNLLDLCRLEKFGRNGRVLHYFQEGFIYHKDSLTGDFWRFAIQGVASGLGEVAKGSSAWRALMGRLNELAPRQEQLQARLAELEGQILEVESRNIDAGTFQRNLGAFVEVFERLEPVQKAEFLRLVLKEVIYNKPQSLVRLGLIPFQGFEWSID